MLAKQDIPFHPAVSKPMAVVLGFQGLHSLSPLPQPSRLNVQRTISVDFSYPVALNLAAKRQENNSTQFLTVSPSMELAIARPASSVIS